jgi:hypothetical protein
VNIPSSIREINALPDAEKSRIYADLIPDVIFADYEIDPVSLTRHGKPAVFFQHRSSSRAVEVTVKRDPADLDPIIYLNMCDTFTYQLLVLLVVVNDPDSPRFNTDVDLDGNATQFGTMTRNLFAERDALDAGLAPGQVRAGLRIFKRAVPMFEQFVAAMGHDLFMIEPLSYHNAIVFERYGFNYVRGRSEMEAIDRDFQPGGALHAKLTADNPFRSPDAGRTIRGRSWAIHDGILGHPFTGFQMYKRIGIHADVCTFCDAIW